MRGPTGRSLPLIGSQGGVGRTAAVLGCFSRERRSLTLSEISRASGLPLTSAHRRVADLVAWGALERADDGRYHVGLRLWEIGTLAPRGVGLRPAALPIMEDLYEVTHENVQLAVRDGAEVVYVERLTGRASVHAVTQPGSRLPAHATGVGLVLLAFAHPHEVSAALTGPLRAFTPHTLTDPAAIRRTFPAIRTAGYVISDRQVEPFSLSVAAPVRDATGAVVAALSLVAPADEHGGRQYVPAVLAAARAISRALTGPLGPG